MSCSALAGGSVVLPRPVRGYGEGLWGKGRGMSTRGGTVVGMAAFGDGKRMILFRVIRSPWLE